jgi:hypothetical protein
MPKMVFQTSPQIGWPLQYRIVPFSLTDPTSPIGIAYLATFSIFFLSFSAFFQHNKFSLDNNPPNQYG